MRKKGFTIIELAIVLLVLAVIVAFLTPLVTGYVEKSRILRATNDCQVLAQAINNFYKDLRTYPVYAAVPLTNTTATVKVLFSEGAEATASGAAGTQDWMTGARDFLQTPMEKGLTSGGQPYPATGLYKWQGPYHTDFKPDPWGTRYYVNVLQFYNPGNNAVWVVCAGPNKTIETNFTQPSAGGTAPSLGGDDIGFRIK